MMNQRTDSVYVLTLLVLLLSLAMAVADSAVYMANGIKIGEVDQNSAIVWTRLTQTPERNADGIPFPDMAKNRAESEIMTTDDLTLGNPLEAMEGAAPGIAGQVQFAYWPTGDTDAKIESDWLPVDPEKDFTRQHRLTNLQPGATYQVRVQGRPMAVNTPTCAVEGRFKTAFSPEAEEKISFVVVTCGDYPRRDEPDKGHKIYDAMLQIKPDFFVHTGDIEYYDKALPWAPNQELARFKWNRLFAMPFQRAFHNSVTSYFMKDDHDTLRNDCWPGQIYGELTWEQGLAIFREQVPMGEKTYRTVRWGKDLQIWLVEGRDFRSPNTMPDGPEKTIWGAEQKEWFKRTVQESDAAFRVLISPTPVVGPDRDGKADNHANAVFTHEGGELRRFMADMGNMIVINGDRHWQYASVCGETGLREFGTGPSSDEHAGGWRQDDFRPEHRYLNLKGGFLHVTVVRENGTPRMTLQHRSVTGEVYNEIKLPDE